MIPALGNLTTSMYRCDHGWATEKNARFLSLRELPRTPKAPPIPLTPRAVSERAPCDMSQTSH
jgi:hypothetical protein